MRDQDFRTRWALLLVPAYALCAAIAVRQWVPLLFLPPLERVYSVAAVLAAAGAATGAGAVLLRPVAPRLLSRVSILILLIVLLCGWAWWAKNTFPEINRYPWAWRALYIGVPVAVMVTPIAPTLLRDYQRVILGAARAVGLCTAAFTITAAASLVTPPTKLGAALASVHAPTAAQGKTRANVLLILLDEWSATRSSLPGLPGCRTTTPALSRLAEGGRVYTHVSTNSLSTRGDLKAVFTGFSPAQLGSTWPEPLGHSLAERTLLRLAQKSGFSVGYVYSHAFTRPSSLGLPSASWVVAPADPCRVLDGHLDIDWLCDVWRDHFRGSAKPEATFALASRLLQRLDNRRPFFLFVHVLAPHVPFEPLPEDIMYSLRGRSRLNLYDDYLRTTDRLAAAFVESVWVAHPRTLVLLFGDHGLRPEGREPVGPETIRVPVLVLGPGVRAGVDSTPMSLADLWPRVLTALVPGLALSNSVVPGASLRSVVETAGRRYKYAVSFSRSHCLVPESGRQAVCFDWDSGASDKPLSSRSPRPAEAALLDSVSIAMQRR